MTERTEIKFTEIVQMIADGTVPEGAKFIADDDCVARLIQDRQRGELALIWDKAPAGFKEQNRVQIAADIINDQWFMEVPEQELSLAEAIEEWRNKRYVTVKFGTSSELISAYACFMDLWEDTALADLDDLLFNSKFYKVN